MIEAARPRKRDSKNLIAQLHLLLTAVTAAEKAAEESRCKTRHVLAKRTSVNRQHKR